MLGCSKISLGLALFIEHSYNGRVIVQQFGVKGTVCRSGWDSIAASVLCRENGFKGGVVYSSSDELQRYEPIWIGSIKVKRRSNNLNGFDTGILFETRQVLLR